MEQDSNRRHSHSGKLRYCANCIASVLTTVQARNSPRVTIYNLYNGQDDEAEGYWWWLEEAIAPISEGSDSNERGTYSGDMDGLAENDLYDTLDDMADNTIR
jgi:hypothetical protein